MSAARGRKSRRRSRVPTQRVHARGVPTRRPAPASRRRTGRRRLYLAAGLVVAVVGGGLALGLALQDVAAACPQSGTERAEAEANRFSERMRLAFTGIVDDIPTFLKRAEEVEAASRPPAELAGDLEASLRRAESVRDLVGSTAGLPRNPVPKELYLRSALLYAEGLRALEVALGTDGALRGQLARQARRLKILSDRIYDRGTAIVDPDVHRGSPDVEIRLPEEVPDWEAEGLAAGPPLTAAPPGPPAEVPPATKDRPGQPVPAWVENISPIVETVRTEAARFPALARAPDLEAARQAAGEIAEAAEATRPVPDPEGKREPTALLRLSMLVDAEAAYAFAATAAAADAPELTRERADGHARNVALLAEDLWGCALERLGRPKGVRPHPRSAFDRTALEPRPVPGR